MKTLWMAVMGLLMGTASSSQAQEVKIDFARLRLHGLPFTATKAQVLQHMGQPTKTDVPNFECGFFSSREQGQKFYSLHYRQATFIGNAKEGYVINEVHFAHQPAAVLMYGPWKLSSKTTLQDLEKAFGRRLKMGKMKTATNPAAPVVSVSSGGDDGAIFWFEDGHLARFEYWTPC